MIEGNKKRQVKPVFFLAEKEGFEPSRPFRSLHDFQSCALDQLGDFSIAVPVLQTVNLCAADRQRYYYSKEERKVNPLFLLFLKKQAGNSFPACFARQRISETMLSTA